MDRVAVSEQELTQQKLDQLVDVCGHLPHFIDKGTWAPTTPLEDLVFRTVARGRGTYETIADLVHSNRTLQAAMLGRSLFEDMVVAHWLVLHWEDPDWLIQQFEDHRDAMRLHDFATRKQMSWPAEDIADLDGREDELRKRFGRYAERDWWGQDRDGRRVTMPQLIERLASSRIFHPRLRGEEPILEQYFALQHKAWTQALHHTAAGMLIRPSEDGSFPLSVAGPTPFVILFGNHWVFGQLIFVALELGAPADALDHFEKLFFAGLAVFGESIGLPVPWADDVADWAAEPTGEAPSGLEPE